jgi:TolA-binding protein
MAIRLLASCVLCTPGQQVARATRTRAHWIVAFFLLVSNSAPAQNTNVPVAPPVAPLAPPADANTNIPIAQPVAPTTPPVALPVIITPADNTTNNATANATNSAPGATLVVVDPAQTRFDAGMSAFSAGQYVNAVREFSEFVRDFPQNRHSEEVLYRLAESYRALGHTKDAYAAYTYQVHSYPEGQLRVTAELQRGAILFDAGKFADAAEALQVVVDKGSGESQLAAKYLLGRCLLQAQKEPEGRALLQPIADMNPPAKFSVGAAQALAELDDSENKYSESYPLWQKTVDQTTDPAAKAQAAARGGWAALQAKQYGDAEKLFQAARQFDPSGDSRKVANTGLLRILFQQKRYDEWIKLYTAEQALLLDSAKAENLYDLGHANFAQKNWADAVAGFDQYLAAFGADEPAVTAAYERFLALAQSNPARTRVEAEAYLKTWPKSPYFARVELIEAQDLTHSKKFTDALPLWESLAAEKGDASWPHQDILLELARTYDELGNFAKAAPAYQAYINDLKAHPNANPKTQTKNLVRTQARLAVCYQKAGLSDAANEAWKTLLTLAPDGSREQETAIESLGLYYAKANPPQEAAMLDMFRKLIAGYPQSPLIGMAAFSVGDSLFKNHDYAGAEPLLLQARKADEDSWMQPATQRLVLGAYGLKNYDKTVQYVNEYDTLPEPTDPQAAAAARLPAALFYWLAETARQANKWDEAETYYTRVTQHPAPGDLIAGAYWQLGEVQSHRKEWASAVVSYEKYRELKPDTKDATQILLALGKAELGAEDTDAAKKLGDQALLQEPEGPRSAAARMLLGETAFAAKDFPQAARMFATLAVLFDDPQIAPQAMTRAGDAFEHAGDAKSAADWRQKLKDKYPQYQPVPYL